LIIDLSKEAKHLIIDLGKCIGCEACTNVCSPGLITIADEGLKRTLCVPLICSEECTRCVDACSERAITFAPVLEIPPTVEYFTATFDLFPCEYCGNPFTTQPILNKLLDSVPKSVGVEPEDIMWLRLCPICRQMLKVENVARKGST